MVKNRLKTPFPDHFRPKIAIFGPQTGLFSAIFNRKWTRMNTNGDVLFL